MDYYGIDFGGTNLRISQVDPETGRLAGRLFSHPMAEVSSNEELTEMVLRRVPEGSSVGISSAGDVDEERLVIRAAANSPIKEEIVFGRKLRETHGCRVEQTNDMNASVQAVTRYGQGRGYRNVLLATYSSGFNCALTRDGRNVTTAEFGHAVYKSDGDLYCGCGGKGHLETYVSGNGAATMARQYLGIRQIRNHPILDFSLSDWNQAREGEKPVVKAELENPDLYAAVLMNISAKHVYMAYRRIPEGQPQKDIRDTQVRAVTDSIARMNSAYNPVDILVLMGSQTQDWEALFAPAIQAYMADRGRLQLHSLGKPKIERAQIKEIGVVGAVAYLLSRDQ